jgi:hypothetical protein
MRFSTLLLSAALLSSTACTNSLVEPPPDEPKPVPTFHEDVEPLLNKHCLNCHVAGGIGTFDMQGYEKAVANAEAFPFELLNRRMPPWRIDSSGSCQTFQDDKSMSDEEIDTILRWIDGGMPQGDPANAPPPPPPPEKLARVDATADMGVAYTPNANLTDDYRCFVVDPQIATDKFLTAFEVKPGVPSEVHHMILFQPNSEQAEANAEALDAQEEGPGYTCFGDARVNADFFAVWAPGSNVQKLPAGTGAKINAGRKLIMQIHYNTLAGAAPDRTAIDLTLEDSVPLEAFNIILGNFDLLLQPGQSAAVSEGEISFAELPFPVRVHSIAPHMHTLGKKMKVSLLRADDNNAEECIGKVDDWDFNWQFSYIYEEPVTVNPGDSIRFECTYDTSDRSEPVSFGEGTQDEMCLAIFYVTL